MIPCFNWLRRLKLKVFTTEDQLTLKETGQESHELFCFGNYQFDFEQLEFDARFNGQNGVLADSLYFEKNGTPFLKAARID